MYMYTLKSVALRTNCLFIPYGLSTLNHNLENAAKKTTHPLFSTLTLIIFSVISKQRFLLNLHQFYKQKNFCTSGHLQISTLECA